MKTSLSLALALSTAACADDPASMAPVDDIMPGEPGGPAAGQLDPSFGHAGIVTLPFDGYGGTLAYHDGKLYACSSDRPTGTTSSLVLARFSLAGDLDTSYGEGGYARYSAGDIDTVCQNFAIDATGRITAVARAGATRYIVGADAAGTEMPEMLFTTDLSAVMTRQGDVVMGSAWKPGENQIVDMNAYAIVAKGALDGILSRPFVSSNGVAVPGVYTSGLSTGWGVARAPVGGDLMLDEHGLGAAGGPAADLMHDSVQLHDGSLFAIGGADNDSAVMTAHLTDLNPAVETHGVGQTSVARTVSLDGEGRPIVLGSATIAGVQQYLWQRYETTTYAVDPSYEAGGIVLHPAPSGGGEIVSSVRVDGAIYALANYDVETNAPKTALLKIAE